MSTPYFQFKQFTVWHDKCAMKVGTDGVLLGAWADVANAHNILDAGCGTGLIALMAAQRNEQATISAIDIDETAVCQAQENVKQSPFATRITVKRDDIRLLQGTYDCIICNPPFYTEQTQSPDARRMLARNTESLSFDDLIAAASRLLSPGGTLHLILPADSRNTLVSSCIQNSLYLYRECKVQTTPSKQPKRVMLSFKKDERMPSYAEQLILQNSDGSRSEQYSSLCKDFYIK